MVPGPGVYRITTNVGDGGPKY